MLFIQYCIMAIVGTIVVSFCLMILGATIKNILKDKGE